MSALSNFAFHYWDPVGTIKKSINDWKPNEISSEAIAEKQLTSHLKAQHQNLEIRNQFPHDRVIADIVIDKKVAVELKFKLKTTSELNRLLGQIDHYHEWEINLIVVIVGECPQDFISKIKRKLVMLWDEDKWALVHKNV